MVHSVKDYAIFLLDPAGRVASWNEGAQRIKGYRESEIVGQHFSVFYRPEVAASGWPEYELKVAAEEGRFEDEGWRVRKDGTEFWANVVITALRDRTGELRGFAKVTRDLTERKLAEESLRSSEERYRLLVEGVRDYAIFMLDEQGNVVTWNLGAERLQGYEASEIIGQHFSRLYPPEAIATGWPDRELELARAEGRFEDEGWRVRKDGSRFWANVVITALVDQTGELRGFSKVTRDATERKRHEDRVNRLNAELTGRVAELAEANRELEAKSEENETFVYSVSHDIRGPLANLLGFSEELERSCEELADLIGPLGERREAAKARSIVTQEMPEALGFINTAVEHLSNIVDSLLRLSRLGRVVYRTEQVDVEAVVRRVLGALKGTVDEVGAEIQLSHLPPVVADTAAVEQVFANLIGNALRYRDPGRRLRVEIGGETTADGRKRVYHVKDNGLGIPESALSNLFLAFRRFHPESGPGEGMGLVTVRRIAERLNGSVRVESTAGAGSTFYFELPTGTMEP